METKSHLPAGNRKALNSEFAILKAAILAGKVSTKTVNDYVAVAKLQLQNFAQIAEEHKAELMAGKLDHDILKIETTISEMKELPTYGEPTCEDIVAIGEHSKS